MTNIHTIEMRTRKFFFDREIKPVTTVHSGDTLIFETEDADVSQITKETDVFYEFSKLYEAAGGTNPITGPVCIEEAKKGDTLAVTIKNIEPGYWRGEGYSSIFAGLGALQNDIGSIQVPLEPRTKICKIENGFVYFKTHDKARTIPIQPFIGTIGVAPIEDRVSAGKMGQDFCGNIDIPAVKVGSKVLLPVNIDGDMLSIGDVHACQGDGEITGCALECQARVTVEVEVIKKTDSILQSWPLLEDEEYLGVLVPLGCRNITEAMQAGYTELIRVMEKSYGFDRLDAYQLLSLAGEVRVGSEYSCLCRVKKTLLK